jgi:hypothetical protein
MKECLFQTGKVSAPQDPLNPGYRADIVQPIIDYMLGVSSVYPQALTDNGLIELTSEGGEREARLEKMIRCMKKYSKSCPKKLKGEDDNSSMPPLYRLQNWDITIAFHQATYDDRCRDRRRRDRKVCDSEKAFLVEAQKFRNYLISLLPPGTGY